MITFFSFLLLTFFLFLLSLCVSVNAFLLCPSINSRPNLSPPLLPLQNTHLKLHLSLQQAYAVDCSDDSHLRCDYSSSGARKTLSMFINVDFQAEFSRTSIPSIRIAYVVMLFLCCRSYNGMVGALPVVQRGSVTVLDTVMDSELGVSTSVE